MVAWLCKTHYVVIVCLFAVAEINILLLILLNIRFCPVVSCLSLQLKFVITLSYVSSASSCIGRVSYLIHVFCDVRPYVLTTSGSGDIVTPCRKGFTLVNVCVRSVGVYICFHI